MESQIESNVLKKYKLDDWQKSRIYELLEDSMDFRKFDFKLGWKNRPNVSIDHQNSIKKITYSINSSGFRSIEENKIQRQNDKIRVLALGDSFVFGSRS